MFIRAGGTPRYGAACYRLTPASSTLKNLYSFYPREDIGALPARILAGFHAPRAEHLPSLLPAYLLGGRGITWSAKRSTDSLYFGGIGLPATCHFLEEHGWPESIMEHLVDNAEQYRHLTFDVARDHVAQEGRPVILRSGIYGCF